MSRFLHGSEGRWCTLIYTTIYYYILLYTVQIVRSHCSHLTQACLFILVLMCVAGVRGVGRAAGEGKGEGAYGHARRSRGALMNATRACFELKAFGRFRIF
jgi:hypothetical protein